MALDGPVLSDEKGRTDGLANDTNLYGTGWAWGQYYGFEWNGAGLRLKVNGSEPHWAGVRLAPGTVVISICMYIHLTWMA